MKLLASLVLASAALVVVPLAQAEDPSLHQVYQAVHEGRLGDAQSMMNQVLKDHPNSAKAHYVEAEVLVRMNRAGEAQDQLSQAERLEPGLPFAKPEAVRDLRGLIAERGAARPLSVDRGTPVESRPADSGFPWGIVMVVTGVGLLIFLILRNRQTAVVPAPGAPGMGYGTPYGTPYGGAPMGGGLGSGIVGGLATGAALGAGMVAGEALAHEFIGNRERGSTDAGAVGGSQVAYDDGGRDFGVSDGGSWDSGGGSMDIGGDGGGGGDWG